MVELHGTLRFVRCFTCGNKEEREAYQAKVRAMNPYLAAVEAKRELERSGGAPEAQVRPDGDFDLSSQAAPPVVVPPCSHCGGNKVMPDVVFFGGSVEKPVAEEVEAGRGKIKYLF